MSFSLFSCVDKEKSIQPVKSGTISGKVKIITKVEVARKKDSSGVPAPYYSGRIIVKYKDSEGKTDLSGYFAEQGNVSDKVLHASKSEDIKRSMSLFEINKDEGIGPKEIKKLVEDLKKDKSVEYVQPEYLRRAYSFENPNDPKFVEQWALNGHFLNVADERWEGIFENEDEIRIAVVDTGYRPHVDLEGVISEETGYDFVSDPELELDDTAGIDPDPTDFNALKGGSAFYHGTFVSGIIAAAKNNEKGISGFIPQTRVFPKIKIFHVRVLGLDGAGTDYDISQGILYAAGLPNSSNVILDENQRAHVINLSLGGQGDAPIIHYALKKAVANDVSIVCAAGNEAEGDYYNPIIYPASYDECISVGALKPTLKNQGFERAEYSGYGPNADIMSPGGSMTPQQYSYDIDTPGIGLEMPESGLPTGIVSTHWNTKNSCWEKDSSSIEECSEYISASGTSFATPYVASVVAMMKSVNKKLTPFGLASILFKTTKGGPEIEDRRSEFGYGVIDPIAAVMSAKNTEHVDEEVIVRLVSPTSYKTVVASFKANVLSDFFFEFKDVEPGNYIIFAGTDYDKDGIICEKSEKFGKYPDQGASTLVLEEEGRIEKIEMKLNSVQFDSECSYYGG